MSIAPSVRAAAALAVGFAAAACAVNPVAVPTVASPLPITPLESGGLTAGLGRADITPPPGLGLQGFGPDGGRARGHRQRLYARALLLQDARGERVAFVVADLGQISVLLHRGLAARTVSEMRLGADRLILAATHTHAGPGNYFSYKSYNDVAGGTRGFDPAIVDFLVDRMFEALRDAESNRTRAVLGWVQAPLWGVTWNRSLEAHALNSQTPDGTRPRPPAGLSAPSSAVDPTWTLLRVDTISRTGDTIPAGAFSVFAVHGTGNPPANDLYDPDVHALVERLLERHIDALTGVSPAFEPRAVHLVANGAEGDVAPGIPGVQDCGIPALYRGHRPAGPRSPQALDEWRPPATESRCLDRARRMIDETGTAMGAHAVALFERAGRSLRGDVTLDRAFLTVPLTGTDAPAGLCDDPRPGSGMLGGTEAAPSGLRGVRVLGIFPIHAREGEVDALDDSCHRPKRAIPWIVRLALSPVRLPEHMQLSVIRIGDVLFAAIPAEATTEAGFRLKDALLRRARATDLPIRTAAIVGLANGYLQYLATPEEYEAQHYEGAATLYGPGSLGAVRTVLEALTASLADGGGARVDSFVVHPGRRVALLPLARGATPSKPRLERAVCRDHVLEVRWFDAAPGDLVPADGPMLRITRSRVGSAPLTVWDDDRLLEIRALASAGRRGVPWEARWSPPEGTRGAYTFTLLRWPPPDNTWGFTCP